MFDLVIRGGHVIDPAGQVDDILNVGVKDGRIHTLTPSAIEGRETVDASGLTVVPGAIDIHMHEDSLRHDGQLTWNTAWFMARMGVTTAVGGNCGTNNGKLVQYYDKIRTAGSPTNYAAFCGHNWLRNAVGCDDRYRAATAAEIEAMKPLLREALWAGAVGLSYGLEYSPGASLAEAVALAMVVGEFPGKVNSIHQRYDAERCVEGVAEAIEISRQSGVPMQISHVGSMCAFGLMAECLKLIDDARADGLDITADCYPYSAFSTGLGTAVFDDGCLERWGVGYDALMVATGPYAGRRMDETLFRKLRTETPEIAIIAFVMQEAEVFQALNHPVVSIGSDGFMRDRQGHPRGAGSFPRVLGRFVREGKMEFMDALRKSTVMNADRFGWKHKGRVQEGCDADLVLVDRNTLIDQATFEEPDLPPVGLHAVIVNGRVQVQENGHRDGLFGTVVL
jgi:N-acyl-D-amino-acid deacylase